MVHEIDTFKSFISSPPYLSSLPEFSHFSTQDVFNLGSLEKTLVISILVSANFSQEEHDVFKLEEVFNSRPINYDK